MQNGFVSRGGSYNRPGMNIQNYRHIIPPIQELIRFCRKQGIPVFYTQAIREPSGIDLLINDHCVLPRAREERLEKFPICVRGTWDADIIDDIKSSYEDHIIIKRRDSAFQDTELRVWLRSARINILIFCGVDTSICVETSLRDGFNQGYDVILVADTTASGKNRHYETTLERVRDYYGIVTHLHEFEEIIKILEPISRGKMDYERPNQQLSEFLEKHNLIDISKRT